MQLHNEKEKRFQESIDFTEIVFYINKITISKFKIFTIFLTRSNF